MTTVKKNVLQVASRICFFTLLFHLIIFTGFISGCSHNGGKSASESAKEIATDSAPEAYHADNDIAMTLMSVTDAIRQGEQLDSTDYNFVGILTDGMGHPLYTDIHGGPGEWEIKVESPSSISLRNLYLGDLLPQALENYITQSLGLTEKSALDPIAYMSKDGAEVSAYSFPGGILRFETTTALTPAGQEGPLMTITASAENL